jgi:rhodanese-related sulfurtransferase
MRSKALILPGELMDSISRQGPLVILDARRENNSTQRNAGNSIPGSSSLKLSGKQGTIPNKASEIVVYGRNSKDSLIALARLVSAGGNARALLGGWQGWLAHTRSYPSAPERQKSPMFRLIVFAILSLLMIASAGFLYSKLQTSYKDD